MYQELSIFNQLVREGPSLLSDSRFLKVYQQHRNTLRSMWIRRAQRDASFARYIPTTKQELLSLKESGGLLRHSTWIRLLSRGEFDLAQLAIELNLVILYPHDAQLLVNHPEMAKLLAQKVVDPDGRFKIWFPHRDYNRYIYSDADIWWWTWRDKSFNYCHLPPELIMSADCCYDEQQTSNECTTIQQLPTGSLTECIVELGKILIRNKLSDDEWMELVDEIPSKSVDRLLIGLFHLDCNGNLPDVLSPIARPCTRTQRILNNLPPSARWLAKENGWWPGWPEYVIYRDTIATRYIAPMVIQWLPVDFVEQYSLQETALEHIREIINAGREDLLNCILPGETSVSVSEIVPPTVSIVELLDVHHVEYTIDWKSLLIKSSHESQGAPMTIHNIRPINSWYTKVVIYLIENNHQINFTIHELSADILEMMQGIDSLAGQLGFTNVYFDNNIDELSDEYRGIDDSIVLRHEGLHQIGSVRFLPTINDIRTMIDNGNVQLNPYLTELICENSSVDDVRKLIEDYSEDVIPTIAYWLHYHT